MLFKLIISLQIATDHLIQTTNVSMIKKTSVILIAEVFFFEEYSLIPDQSSDFDLITTVTCFDSICNL